MKDKRKLLRGLVLLVTLALYLQLTWWSKFRSLFMLKQWLQTYPHYTVECSISVFCRHNGRVHWSLETNLVLSQLRFTPPQMSPQVSFLLTISESFSWMLCSNQKQVSSECQFLSATPSRLSSVKSILSLLEALDGSQYCFGQCCFGNSDDKLACLVQRCKGEFKDKFGNTILLLR